MPPAEHEVQVLAVGASAAGLRSSLALSRYGFRHVLVERHRGTAHTPRPHILNQRTVETLRHFGIDDRFHAAATPQESVRINLWVTTLFGKGRATGRRGSVPDRTAEPFAASPCLMSNYPQKVFVPALLQATRPAFFALLRSARRHLETRLAGLAQAVDRANQHWPLSLMLARRS
jgi:2,4-dichlorophenol 6-monooxygenase